MQADNLVSYLSSMQNSWMLNALLSPKYCGIKFSWGADRETTVEGLRNSLVTEDLSCISQGKLKRS